MPTFVIVGLWVLGFLLAALMIWAVGGLVKLMTRRRRIKRLSTDAG